MAGTEGQGYLGLVPDIVYGEEILHLYQNMINFLFMVGIWYAIGPGTENEQKAYAIIFGSQSCLLVTERVKPV